MALESFLSLFGIRSGSSPNRLRQSHEQRQRILGRTEGELRAFTDFEEL